MSGSRRTAICSLGDTCLDTKVRGMHQDEQEEQVSLEKTGVGTRR